MNKSATDNKLPSYTSFLTVELLLFQTNQINNNERKKEEKEGEKIRRKKKKETLR